MAQPLQDPARKRFTVDEVDRMVAAGILGEDDPVELVEGDLLLVSPQDPHHAALTEEIRRRLEAAYAGTGAHTRTHSPLRSGADSLPEPDVAVLRGRPLDYLERHPAGSDTLLVVEVAATAPHRDRAKLALYARAGVPVVWLLDLSARRLEVHREPRGDGRYGQREVLTPGDRVDPPGTDATLAVAEIVPDAPEPR